MMDANPMPSSDLVSGRLSVATVGIDLLDEALVDQGVSPARVDWRPPVPGSSASALASISLSNEVAQANEQALDALTSCRPHLVAIDVASNAVGLEPGTFLHAGPPIGWDRASGPLRGALIGAAMLEGLAENHDEASAMFARGDFSLEPCHGRAAVGPMAGVVSPSMPMFVVEDDATAKRSYCTLNEGLGKVLRYGAFSAEVLDRLRWIERSLAPTLADVLVKTGPIDLFALVAEALQMGDECHNRSRAATSLFLRAVGAPLLELGGPSADLAACYRFMSGNEHFFLNLTMPAAKLAADRARGIDHSTMVVAMARNGTDFGIQLAGTGEEWFTGPSGTLKGLLFPGYTDDDANPDIGDSTITETAGVGAFAMAAAPAIVSFIGGDAELAVASTRSMYDICLGEHPAFRLPVLDFRGTPVGIDAALVCRTGVPPVVNTGIAGKVAGTGQVGAGLVEPPLSCFAAAIDRFVESNQSTLSQAQDGHG